MSVLCLGLCGRERGRVRRRPGLTGGGEIDPSPDGSSTAGGTDADATDLGTDATTVDPDTDATTVAPGTDAATSPDGGAGWHGALNRSGGAPEGK